MNPKTKTASLILQKVPLKERANPESKHSIIIDIESKTRPIIETPKNQMLLNTHNRKLALQHLGHYDTFNLTFQPQVLPNNGQQGSSKLMGSEEYCQLERQNYRLIQTNFNLLTKLAGMVEMFRQQCLKIVQYIEQYHYVLAIEVVYQLIDMLRNIDTTTSKDVRDSVMFGIQREPPSSSKQNQIQPSSRQAKIIKQFQACPPDPHNSSIVEEYSLGNSKKKVDDAFRFNPPEMVRKILQLSSGVTFAHYEPPKPIRHQQDYILEQETPYFCLDDSRFKRSSLDVFHGHAGDRAHERLMMTSLDQLGFSSRVESVAGDGARKLYTESFHVHAELRQDEEDHPDNFSEQRSKLRPLSEKNITIFKGGNRKSMVDQSKTDELYRCLFVQASTIEELFSSQ